MNRDLDDRDGPRDECGVFGVFAPERDVARLAYFALFALQHRGQESAGIAAAQSGQIMTVRDLGLVSQVFDEEKLRALQGQMAIGHVRYSTTGSSAWENAQPVWRSDRRQVALAHNGNLINAVELHAELSERGVNFRGTSDSEIIAALLSNHEADRIEDAVADVVPRLEGAFSTVVMTKDAVVAFRDPAGLRPLALGKLGRRPLHRIRELRVRHHRRGARARGRAGRDGLARGAWARVAPARGVGAARVLRLRAHLLRAAGLDPRGQPHAGVAPQDGRDPVARGAGRGRRRDPVPDSGNPAAAGYSKASGIPRDDGLIKNRYVQRTFIQPGQDLRKHGLRMKFNPLREVVEGKRLVVVDDSIVRGNTTRQIVQMLRDAGAAEIHMRISAPPIRHPCHYGIDMSTTQEMVAYGRTEDEVAEELGCDSIRYLSLDGVYEAIRSTRATHCDACFSGDYPLERTDSANGKFALEELPVVKSSVPV